MEDIVISLSGLGYVGLPLALALATYFPIIGFDKNSKRIQALKEGFDENNECTRTTCLNPNIVYTEDPSAVAQANFHIIAVPTPIDGNNQPDLTLLIQATENIARFLKKGDIVLYESTVYPGTTEEICLPILERLSHLKSPADFGIGYSPERINPGDKIHHFSAITKVISANTKETLSKIKHVYGQAVKAGVYEASSIKIAEAAKIIENTQRDLNIALMNELALIFHRLDIDTLEVIEAASTKWNFMPFKPGLVGGHCIGVDPYYLTYKAQQVGYHPEVILAGRRINDNMGKYIAEHIVKTLLKQGHAIAGARIGILGLTFKENCSDLRNTKVISMIDELKTYSINPIVHDPIANPTDAYTHYGIEMVSFEALKDMDALVIAVAHQAYRDLNPRAIQNTLKKNAYLFDIKGILDKEAFEGLYPIWRL